jgi:HKD family nuclease
MGTRYIPAVQGRKFRSVFGFSGDRAVVIGLPTDFNFDTAIAAATEIRLATAFAHLKGWKLIAPALLRSCAGIRLLTGLDFFQTEPKLLREWNRLTSPDAAQPNISARLARKVATFHPKLLIAKLADSTANFAIVGSGNLSFGGLRSNTECSLYTNDSADVWALTEWFDGEWNEAADFTNAEIKEYERKYKKSRKATAQIRKAQKEAEERMEEQAEAIFRERKKAIASASRYFKSQTYSKAYESRREGVRHIREALNMPSFEFDKTAWNKFYGIPALGRLRQVYRDPIFNKEKRLKDAMRYLLNESVAIRKRLAAVLEENGAFHIRGLGLNIVSKVLAVHDSKRWPVFNGPVEKTLRHFGYEPPRGMGKVGRYLKFAEAMEGFRVDSGAPDVFALDTFFKWYEGTKLNSDN